MKKSETINCSRCNKLLDLSIDPDIIWARRGKITKKEQNQMVEPCYFCGLPFCWDCEKEHNNYPFEQSNAYWSKEANDYAQIWP